ncbi:hypothetical protein NHQ30_011373 [Ciborinia camelliae]|nr:hypothetical protein NHQ30_011373 [Ciborinia camelliae]
MATIGIDQSSTSLYKIESGSTRPSTEPPPYNSETEWDEWLNENFTGSRENLSAEVHYLFKLPIPKQKLLDSTPRVLARSAEAVESHNQLLEAASRFVFVENRDSFIQDGVPASFIDQQYDLIKEDLARRQTNAKIKDEGAFHVTQRQLWEWLNCERGMLAWQYLDYCMNSLRDGDVGYISRNVGKSLRRLFDTMCGSTLEWVSVVNWFVLSRLYANSRNLGRYSHNPTNALQFNYSDHIRAERFCTAINAQRRKPGGLSAVTLRATPMEDWTILPGEKADLRPHKFVDIGYGVTNTETIRALKMVCHPSGLLMDALLAPSLPALPHHQQPTLFAGEDTLPAVDCYLNGDKWVDRIRRFGEPGRPAKWNAKSEFQAKWRMKQPPYRAAETREMHRIQLESKSSNHNNSRPDTNPGPSQSMSAAASLGITLVTANTWNWPPSLATPQKHGTTNAHGLITPEATPRKDLPNGSAVATQRNSSYLEYSDNNCRDQTPSRPDDSQVLAQSLHHQEQTRKSRLDESSTFHDTGLSGVTTDDKTSGRAASEATDDDAMDSTPETVIGDAVVASNDDDDDDDDDDMGVANDECSSPQIPDTGTAKNGTAYREKNTSTFQVSHVTADVDSARIGDARSTSQVPVGISGEEQLNENGTGQGQSVNAGIINERQMNEKQSTGTVQEQSTGVVEHQSTTQSIGFTTDRQSGSPSKYGSMSQEQCRRKADEASTVSTPRRSNRILVMKDPNFNFQFTCLSDGPRVASRTNGIPIARQAKTNKQRKKPRKIVKGISPKARDPPRSWIKACRSSIRKQILVVTVGL